MAELPVWPPDMSAVLYGRINNPDWNFPLPDTHKMAQIFKLTPSYIYGHEEPLVNHRQLSSVYMCLADNRVPETRKRAENALNQMVRCHLGLDNLRNMPLGIAAPLREACRTCQLSPGGDWPVSAYQLIGRNDLAEGLSTTPDLLYSYGYHSKKDYIVRTFAELDLLFERGVSARKFATTKVDVFEESIAGSVMEDHAVEKRNEEK